MGAFRYSTGTCSTLMRAACCLPTTLTITTSHHQHYFENIHEAVLLSGLIWCWFMPSDLSRSQIPKTSSLLILKPAGQSEKWTHTNNLWSFQVASNLSSIKFFRTIASLLSYEIYLVVKNWSGQTMSECQRNGNVTFFFHFYSSSLPFVSKSWNEIQRTSRKPYSRQSLSERISSR